MKNLDFLTKTLIAHRGMHDEKIPENSILSFKEAIKNNYIIELDVHLLKDNTIIVFHDDNLKRMTGIDKKLKYLNYEEVKDIKLNHTSEKIPTLNEVLQLVNGKVPIIIEIKYDRRLGLIERELVKILDNYDGKFAIKSFRPMSVYFFKKYRPEYIRGLLVNNKYSNLRELLNYKMLLLKFCNPDFISCKKNMFNNKKIKRFKKNKLVFGWTINDEKSYNIYKKKFDNLICNNIKKFNK